MHCAQLLNKSEDYIEANLHKRITLDDLAKSLHVSKYHYHRQFSSCSPETLHQYISRIKLERSAAILATSTDSITKIASAYGYSESSAYSKAFKRHFKLSPSQYRKARLDKPTGIVLS